MKRTNPFIRIYKQCNGLTNMDKYKIIEGGGLIAPIYLDIELTNYCNIHCNMCPVGTGDMHRSRGFMSDAVFERIMKDVMRYHIEGVRLIRWGEPTLHPKFIEWAKVLKSQGVLLHFNTNGLHLDDEMISKIIESGIDSIKFSFQGIDELTYGEMRSGGSYTQLLDTIRAMYISRSERKSPYISITTSTTYESEEEIENFKRVVSPYCDEVSIGKTKMRHVDVERMKLSDERRRIYEHFINYEQGSLCHMSVCPEIWDKLSINWDGSVSACCQDYDNLMIVGNILENDLAEIFTGEMEKKYREIIRKSEYEKLPLCKNCYEYIPLKR